MTELGRTRTALQLGSELASSGRIGDSLRVGVVGNGKEQHDGTGEGTTTSEDSGRDVVTRCMRQQSGETADDSGAKQHQQY